MKKALLFFILLGLLAGCKKPADVKPADPADEFIGTWRINRISYSRVLLIDGVLQFPFNSSDRVVIEKTDANTVTITIYYPTPFGGQDTVKYQSALLSVKGNGTNRTVEFTDAKEAWSGNGVVSPNSQTFNELAFIFSAPIGGITTVRCTR